MKTAWYKKIAKLSNAEKLKFADELYDRAAKIKSDVLGEQNWKHETVGWSNKELADLADHLERTVGEIRAELDKSAKMSKSRFDPNLFGKS